MIRFRPLIAPAAVFLGFLPSAIAGLDPATVAAGDIAAPSAELTEQFDLTPFYKKHLSVGGFPVLASEQVSDYALREAGYLIAIMLKDQPAVLESLIENRVRFAIMAPAELTTKIPEHSDLKPSKFWDRRARGLGATKIRPAVSCGEENLLGYKGDPYSTENILIHEFAHAMDEMGLCYVYPEFNNRLEKTYQAAVKKGLWKGKYAATNRREYFAEGVQSWFDTNREDDHDHNHVNTRAELRDYDPELAKLVEESFGDGDWRYTHPRDRTGDAAAHLRGFDPAKAPTFAWPKKRQEWYDYHQKLEAAGGR